MPSKLAKIRQHAYSQQQYRCYYCEHLMWADNPIEFVRTYRVSIAAARLFQCTAEHLVPTSCGGRDSMENIVAACLFCNRTRHRAKKPLKPSEYRGKVRARVSRGRWFPFGLARQMGIRKNCS
jgi:5-methylcytosine-specific restriction endonuclease McrA